MSNMHPATSFDGDYRESPKYLKRKVKSGHVTADYDNRDLILTYEVEATVVGDTGKAMQTERKTHRMPMKVKLDAHTDVRLYARQLVAQSDLIPNNKVQHVENLLQELKEMTLEERYRADSVSKIKRDTERKRKEERRKQKLEEKRRREEEKANEELDSANMDDLSDYLEKLYDDDMSAKVHGTSMILQLARNAGNLEDLSENEALLGALSRTLREDARRKMELSLHIMNIFCAFSTFSQFHQYLHNHQVGNNTMRAIKWELDRHAARVEEMGLLERVAEAQKRGETPEVDPRKEKKRHEPIDMKVERAKTKGMERKQDKLLCASLQVLINLAEDDRVERKMAKRDLAQDLVRILATRNSTNADLLVLACTFIQKLSVTRENKDEFRDFEVVEHLIKFIPCSNDRLMKAALSALFNLSFDAAIREQMVKCSIIPKLVDLLQEKQFRAAALRILYHLSIDDSCKSMFTYTEIIPYMMRMIIDFPSQHVGKELAALAINLSLNERNCSFMCQGNNFKGLIERAIKRQDPLLLKVARNIARWTLKLQEELPDPVPKTVSAAEEEERIKAVLESSSSSNSGKRGGGSSGEDETLAVATRKRSATSRGSGYKCKRMWSPYVKDLVLLLKLTDNQSVLVETLGILACLTPADLSKSDTFGHLVLEHDLVEFLHKHLLPGFSEDDVLLEVVIMIGQLCLDADAAHLICSSALIKLIYDVLHEKQEDSEIVLQTLYTFHRLLRHPGTGHALLYETQMPRDVCDLLEHRNPVVRCMADNLLDLIVDHDEANETSMDINRRIARKAISGTRGDEEKSKGRHFADLDAEEGEEEVVSPEPDQNCYSELKGTLSKMIRAKRFTIHNKEWIDMVMQEELDDLEDHDDDDDDDDSELQHRSRYRSHHSHGANGDDDDDDDGDEDDEDDNLRHQSSVYRHHHHHVSAYGPASPLSPDSFLGEEY
ncbi:Kinesin-associated protein 3 [Hondaea fermentalgiana]|uniref:Kinesin-associated protein 3 n=1 Tax=Hondaea fermentalgiana TaxID=2315210 RepID=A0A2R5GT37_9STRA|nr:Kinesin-associated protein 3 [Hondaea fermentalgiana]|eukprot:GBG31044.1 Kinesin-associated protein 3 [Hondaea fermentalgiana]